MIKEDVVKLCKKAPKMGYITHSKILDIYDDGEEVPEFVVNLVIHKPYREEHVMILGEHSYRLFNELIEEYWEKHIKK